MVSVDRPLITSHYTGVEFKSGSALNVGVSIEDLNESMVKTSKRSMMHRKKSQSKVRKSMKF